MTSNPEAVGQLLATTALMNGERELLRRRDGPSAETSKAATPPKAPPIDIENKAIATVLLTLLDEQLHAAESAAAAQAKPQNLADSDVTASKLAASRYAADGFARGNDPGVPEPMIGNDQLRMQAMPALVSADLQTFMQWHAAAAAETARAARENVGASSRGAALVTAFFGRASPLRFAGIAAALLWLVALIVQWAAR